MRKAHRDFFCCWLSKGATEDPSIEARSVEGCSVVMRSFVPASSASTQVLKNLRIENRRAYLVNAHRPFAEVDLAAAIAAKRKVLSARLNQCVARRAVRQFRGFFTRSHMNRRALRGRSSLMVSRPHYYAQHGFAVHSS